MKKVYFLLAIVLSIVFVSGITYGQKQMICQHNQKQMGEKVEKVEKVVKMEGAMPGMCKMGPEMMGKMCGMMGGMEEGMRCCKKEFFLCCKQELGLTDDQVKALKTIKTNFMKEDIQKEADLKIAHMELQDLLQADKVDLPSVEKKIKAVSNLEADKKIAHIKAFEKAKEVLTPEQLKKQKECMMKM